MFSTALSNAHEKTPGLDALVDYALGLDGDAGAIAATSLADFCEQYLWIQDKQDQLIPLRLNRAQRHFAEHVTGRDLILKARQLGFSTVIAALMFKTTVERSARSVSMAHDDDTTQKLRRMAKLFYDNLRGDTWITRTQDNAAVTSYSNGSEVTIKTAGSKQGGRGGTYGGVFHGSEVAFWTDAKAIIAGAMQGVSRGGIVILESTPNGTQGLFYEEVQKAKIGESDYTLHFYPWWWDDTYCVPLEQGETLRYSDDEQVLVDRHGLTPEQIKWRRKKLNEPGMRDIFKQEYPEDTDTCFLTSGDSAFADVHLALRNVSQSAPIPGHEYVAGLDWGQDNDYTTLSIIDRVTHEEVALQRWRREPYAVIRQHVVQTCKAWNVSQITPERNSMSSNVEALIDDFSAAGLRVSVYPLVMTNLVKHELVTLFKTGYQADGLTLLDIPYATQELNTFVKKQTASMLWTYAAEGDGHDDTVIARLLAWHCMFNQRELIVDYAPPTLRDYRG
jgi:hypothetical protein